MSSPKIKVSEFSKNKYISKGIELEIVLKILAAVANVFAIVASGIAIYIFIAKRDIITSAFRVLLNYSSQITLSEFRAKLERLNDYTADDKDQKAEVINILNEILGQIKGSKLLSKQFKDNIPEIQSYAWGKRKITEPKKRSLVSELRERLRHINVENYAELMGE